MAVFMRSLLKICYMIVISLLKMALEVKWLIWFAFNPKNSKLSRKRIFPPSTSVLLCLSILLHIASASNCNAQDDYLDIRHTRFSMNPPDGFEVFRLGGALIKGEDNIIMFGEFNSNNFYRELDSIRYDVLYKNRIQLFYR